MNIFASLNPKTRQYLIPNLVILAILAGMLSACNMNFVIPTPTNEVGAEFTPSQNLLGSQELTLVIPTEVATETAPTKLIEIDMDNIIYPPMGDVEENFEKGEYDASVEIIKRWISVWGKMGVFDEIGNIYDNGLVLVPLDGREKVTCVALKGDKYAKTLYCPPIDNNIGGLKIISDSNQGQETDKPIIVSLTGTEGSTTRGKGYGLTYQIADKYTNEGIRYYDINTKGFVEGSFIAPLEVKENDPVEGSVVCVADEFCMGGQMEVDPEMGKIFYEKYMDALIHNGANKDYFDKLLNGDITYQALQQYLDKNDGLLPSGLRLLKNAGHGYVDMTYITKELINVSALKTIVIGPKEWHENYYNMVGYLNEFDKSGMLTPYSTLANWAYFGWFLDRDNYLVLVNGALDFVTDDWPYILGGVGGSYIPERDNKIATSHAISFIVYTEKHTGKGWGDEINPFFPGSSSSPQEGDIDRILGGNLFKVR